MGGVRSWMALVAALALLVGCAPDDDAPDAPSADPEAEEEMPREPFGDRILVIDHDKGGPLGDGLQEMFELAQEELGIQIEVTQFADTTAYQQSIQSSLPTDSPPDLVTWWSGYRMEDLVASGELVSLNDQWDDYIANDYLSGDLADAFRFDGEIYGVPLHVSYWPVFYNVEMFDELGLDVPETWDELIQVADTLVDNDITPFFATTDGRWPAFIWFEEFIIRTDPDFYARLVEGDESYDDPLVIDAMEEWGEWIERGYFTPLDTDMNDHPAMMAEGEVAMSVQGTWFNSAYQGAGLEPGDGYDTFILPNRDPGLGENVIIFETSPLALTANANNRDEALEFLDWWVEPDTQAALASRIGDTPASPAVPAPDAAMQSLVDRIDEGDYRSLQRYWEASPPAIVEAAVDELSRFMLNPDQASEVATSIEGIAQMEWGAR